MNQYMYLLSEAHQNKANFSTRLGMPYKISHDEQLYVSLSELIIPDEIQGSYVTGTSEYPLELAVYVPFLTNGIFVRMTVPSGKYNSSTFCAKINRLMKETLGDKFDEDLCRFSYN